MAISMNRVHTSHGLSATVFCLLLVFGLAGESFSQSRVGTTASTFLTLGMGARGQALGHAYTAEATGVDALFWNPAGASRAYRDIHTGSVMFTHFNWFADIDYNAAGVVIPVIGSGVVGLSLAMVNYGEMEVRTVALPEGTGESFRSSDLALGLTYSTALTSDFRFGGTVKYVNQKIRDMSADAFAFDFGFVLQTQYLNGMRIAAAIRNFGTKMQMRGINGQVFVDINEANRGNNESIPARIEMDRWDLPLSFKFGVAVPLLETNGVTVLALGDVNQTNDNNLNSDLGGQLSYGNKTFNIDFRAGYKDVGLDNVDSHFTFGAGLDVGLSSARFAFDYAYTPFDLLGDTQMLDFRIYF